MDMKDSITPGEILLEEYLKPMGISQNVMARAIGVSPRAINEIVLGRRSITPPMSIRFGAFFGQSDKFWHGIQVECDFRKLAGDRNQLIADINRLRPWQPVARAVTALDLRCIQVNGNDRRSQGSLVQELLAMQ